MNTLDKYFTTQTEEIDFQKLDEELLKLEQERIEQEQQEEAKRQKEEQEINKKLTEMGYQFVDNMSMSKKKCILKGYTELPKKEIAKLIRNDLKKEFGKSIKFSVRSSYTSISVTIKEISREHILTREQYEEVPMVLESKLYKETERYNSFIEAYEKEHIALYMIQDETYDWIKKIVDEYNYSNCDCYHDYYEYNFYDNISTCYDIKVFD